MTSSVGQVVRHGKGRKAPSNWRIQRDLSLGRPAKAIPVKQGQETNIDKAAEAEWRTPDQFRKVWACNPRIALPCSRTRQQKLESSYIMIQLSPTQNARLDQSPISLCHPTQHLRLLLRPCRHHLPSNSIHLPAIHRFYRRLETRRDRTMIRDRRFITLVVQRLDARGVVEQDPITPIARISADARRWERYGPSRYPSLFGRVILLRSGVVLVCRVEGDRGLFKSTQAESMVISDLFAQLVMFQEIWQIASCD